MDAHPASIYAVGAIQELERLVNEKDARIAALERRLALLEDAFATQMTTRENTVDRASAEAPSAGSPR